MLNQDLGRWNNLCMGTKSLIQETGPASCSGPFTRSMLESQRAWFVRLHRDISISYAQISDTVFVLYLQIVQDIGEGRNCFLSDPEWRNLLDTAPEPAVVGNMPGLRLRVTLCDILVGIPDLVEEATRVMSSFGAEPSSTALKAKRQMHVFWRVIAEKLKLESWYMKEVQPLLKVELPIPESTDSKLMLDPNNNSTAPTLPVYQELLLAVNDCVANAILLTMERLLLGLSAKCKLTMNDNVANTLQDIDTVARKIYVNRAFDYVKSTSPVAAKPLEFGLKQLHFNTEQVW